MPSENKQEIKTRLHSRNKNRESYDLNALSTLNTELKGFIIKNKLGEASIDFSNARAVKLLNTAILQYYYGLTNWEFPETNLCPAVPGRADYIHHIADLLGENNSGIIPMGDKITCLDVGVGASCIYPLIGIIEYGWRFIGSDIDPRSIESAKTIIQANISVKGMIDCRLQKNISNVFCGIIQKEDKIDLTICNPPFHSTIEDGLKGTRRKIKNLSGKKVITPKLNFAGISHELIYEGGEFAFIETMIRESKLFSTNCFWFSTLVSKESNLIRIYALLKKNDANQVKTISLATGNKQSRIVAWTFLSENDRKKWIKTRWT